MSVTGVIEGGAAALAALGLGAGARARVKAAQLVATAEVWRGEAEAQKARGDRYEAAFDDLKEEISSLRSEVRRLTRILRAVAPELIDGGMNDDND